MPEKCTQKRMDALIKSYRYIKVNLPSTITEYRSGNGEGTWAVAASKKDAALAQGDTTGKQFFAHLCNDSAYYPTMTYGTRVLCETRGDCRPVAVWDDLQDTENASSRKDVLIRSLSGR